MSSKNQCISRDWPCHGMSLLTRLFDPDAIRDSTMWQDVQDNGTVSGYEHLIKTIHLYSSKVIYYDSEAKENDYFQVLALLFSNGCVGMLITIKLQSVISQYPMQSASIVMGLADALIWQNPPHFGLHNLIKASISQLVPSCPLWIIDASRPLPTARWSPSPALMRQSCATNIRALPHASTR